MSLMDILRKICQNSKLQILLITFLTLLAFSDILQNGFLIDDEMFIKDWSQAHSLSNLPDLLQGNVPDIHKGVYRPIRSVLYAVYWQLWGANPVGYHLHSIAVHLVVTLLVFLIIRRILRSEIAAFAGGLLFGLHPVHTEAITYISASMEVTGAVFFFAAFYFYIRLRQEKSPPMFYVLCSMFFSFLAFFTYEMTLTLPVLLLLYEVIINYQSKIKNLIHNSKFLIPYFVLAILYFIVRFAAGTGISRGEYLGYSFYHTQLTMVKVYVKYLWLLVNPTQISYIHELASGFESFMTHHSNIYSILSQSIFDLDILASIGILAGLVFIAFKFWKKQTIISFSILWFFISLLPVSYLFPQGIAIADKYLYIPSFGFVLVLAYLISKFQLRGQTWTSKFQILIIVAIAVSYGYLTFQRNRDWHDPITFWTRVVSQHPRSALGYYSLGVYYSEIEEQEQAEEAYKKTIEIQPNFWEAHQNLANIYKNQGDLRSAYEHYQQVLTYNQEFLPAQENIKMIVGSTWQVIEVDHMVLRFPNWWNIVSKNPITLKGKNGFTVKARVYKLGGQKPEGWLKSQKSQFGQLVSEGLAKIPNVDSAYVRVWDDNNIQKLQFFLFKENLSMEFFVWPGDSAEMKVFDDIISSLTWNF